MMFVYQDRGVCFNLYSGNKTEKTDPSYHLLHVPSSTRSCFRLYNYILIDFSGLVSSMFLSLYSSSVRLNLRVILFLICGCCHEQ